MSFTYHLTMSTGAQVDIRADSAGEAIHLACHRMRGYTVTGCFAGGDPDPTTPELYREAGRLNFDIPRHDPFPVDPGPGSHAICACYIRAGDIIHVASIQWRVLEIDDLPVRIAFGCESIRGFSGKTELAYKKYQILPITRPALALPSVTHTD